jgi:hypothetical protein
MGTCETCKHNGIASMECIVCERWGDVRSRWQPHEPPAAPEPGNVEPWDAPSREDDDFTRYFKATSRLTKENAELRARVFELEKADEAMRLMDKHIARAEAAERALGEAKNAATELQGQFDRAIAQRDTLARDLRAAREAVKTLGKCRRCDGTGKTRGICKDPRCGEPGWDHYCGEDEKVSCPDCDGTGMLAAARAILDQKPMTALRWWAWNGPAHIRRGRGPALCGARLDHRACYEIPGQPRCPECERLGGDKVNDATEDVDTQKEHPEDRKMRLEAQRRAADKIDSFVVSRLRQLRRLILTYSDDHAYALLSNMREEFWGDLDEQRGQTKESKNE